MKFTWVTLPEHTLRNIKDILIHTVVSLLIASGLLSFLLIAGSGAAGLLAFFYFLFCAPIPTCIAVLVYRSLKNKFTGKRVYAMISAGLLLLLIYHFCLFVLIAVDSGFSLSGFLHKVSTDYTDEYVVPTFSVFLLVICIVLADLVIAKVKSDWKKGMLEQENKR